MEGEGKIFWLLFLFFLPCWDSAATSDRDGLDIGLRLVGRCGHFSEQWAMGGQCPGTHHPGPAKQSPAVPNKGTALRWMRKTGDGGYLGRYFVCQRLTQRERAGAHQRQRRSHSQRQRG